jgi:hypothetical protein
MANDSSEKTVLIIVGIVGGVILLVALGCCGLGFLAFRGMGQAFATAMEMAQEVQAQMLAGETFAEDLANGQFDEAYAQTSKAYQERVSLEQFRALLAKHPALKNSEHELEPDQVGTGTTRFDATFTSRDGKSVKATFHVKKEDEGWKVDRVRIGDDGKPDPDEPPVEPKKAP